MSRLTVLNTKWFSQLDTTQIIGIIKAQDNITGEIFFYIGVTNGEDEKNDTIRILEYGHKVTQNFIDKLVEE